MARVKELDQVLDAPAAFRRRVQHCKIIEAYADGSAKLEWCVGAELLWLDDLLVQLVGELPGGELKQGRAPRNNMERRVSEGIASLSRR